MENKKFQERGPKEKVKYSWKRLQIKYWYPTKGASEVADFIYV